MLAHSGEVANRDEYFRCSSCHNKVHVPEGQQIPKCPKCGNDTFDLRETTPLD